MKTKSLTKEDVGTLRVIFHMVAFGGYDAQMQYSAAVALAKIIERIDPKGEKLLKKKVLDQKN